MDGLKMLSNDVYFDQPNDASSCVQQEVVIRGYDYESEIDRETQLMYERLCPISSVNSYTETDYDNGTTSSASSSNASSVNGTYGYNAAGYSGYLGGIIPNDRCMSVPEFADTLYNAPLLAPTMPSISSAPSISAAQAVPEIPRALAAPTAVHPTVDSPAEMPPLAQHRIKSPPFHKCGICMFNTEHLEELKEHITEHIGGPDNDTYIEYCMQGDSYHCFLCDFSTFQLEQFSIHTAKHKYQVTTATASSSLTRPIKQEYESDHADDERAASSSSRGKVSHGELTLHRCTGCNFSTYNQKQLAKHQLVHRQKCTHNCPNCEFSTASPKAYYLHKQTHTTERHYPCAECDYRGRTKSGLNQHKQTHKAPKFQCQYCAYRSGKQARIVRHERTHTGEKPYQCPHCEFCCNQDGTLNIHIRRHTGDRPYKCAECCFTTISCSSLKTHMKKHTTNKDTFNCIVCHQVYLSRGSLKVHMKEHQDHDTSGDGDPAAAASVVEGEPQPSLLQLSRTSRGAGVPKENKQPFYMCTQCPFKSSTFAKLSAHSETHKDPTPKKPRAPAFKCNVCAEVFTRRRQLRLHVDTHLPAEALPIAVGQYVLKMERDDL